MIRAGFLLSEGPRKAFAVLLAFASIFLFACGGSSPGKSELHGITSEIVSAAGKASNRKSTVTIHSETPSFHGVPIFGEPSIDNISVSVNDSLQAAAFDRALGEIARRHKMSVVESASGGVSRFDLALRGIRTHTIRVATPLRARVYPPAPHAGSPRLAIIVDDLGSDRAAGDAVLALPFPLTLSVLPHLPFSSEISEKAFRRGDQVLLHLPMEAESGAVRPEPDELRVGMSAQDVPGVLAGMLATVPHAAGVNNHEGSRATSDPALMGALMPALRERGLFFVDSRTAATTVAYDAALRSGVAAASRKVFLDDEQTPEAIQAQLDLAATDAIRDGTAIAIGHPHPVTIAALARNVAPLEARGIRLVFASALVH